MAHSGKPDSGQIPGMDLEVAMLDGETRINSDVDRLRDSLGPEYIGGEEHGHCFNLVDTNIRPRWTRRHPMSRRIRPLLL